MTQKLVNVIAAKMTQTPGIRQITAQVVILIADKKIRKCAHKDKAPLDSLASVLNRRTQSKAIAAGTAIGYFRKSDLRSFIEAILL
jgi:hypothetical protein